MCLCQMAETCDSKPQYDADCCNQKVEQITTSVVPCSLAMMDHKDRPQQVTVPHLESMGNTVFATAPSLVSTQRKIFKSVNWPEHFVNATLVVQVELELRFKNKFRFLWPCVCPFNVHYWKAMSIAKMRKILQSAMLSKNYEFNEGESRFQKKQTKKYLQRCHSFKFRDF